MGMSSWRKKRPVSQQVWYDKDASCSNSLSILGLNFASLHRWWWHLHEVKYSWAEHLCVYYFMSQSRIFHWYGDVTIAGEGLQKLGLCSFEQEGIFIMPHLLLHRTFVFPVSSEGRPHSVIPYNTQGGVKDLF
jgi:hypothetical protein